MTKTIGEEILQGFLEGYETGKARLELAISSVEPMIVYKEVMAAKDSLGLAGNDWSRIREMLSRALRELRLNE